MSNLIIAGDGYAYITYSYSLRTHTQSGCYTISDHTELRWRALRVASNGDHSEIVLHDWASDANSVPLAHTTWFSLCGVSGTILH